MLRMLQKHGSVKVGGKFMLHAQWQMVEMSSGGARIYSQEGPAVRNYT